METCSKMRWKRLAKRHAGERDKARTEIAAAHADIAAERLRFVARLDEPVREPANAECGQRRERHARADVEIGHGSQHRGRRPARATATPPCDTLRG